MPNEGRSYGDVARKAFELSGREGSTQASSLARATPGYPNYDIDRVNRFGREMMRVGSGYRGSPNRQLLRGAARRGYRG